MPAASGPPDATQWHPCQGLQPTQAAGTGSLGAVTHRESNRQAGKVLLQVSQGGPIPHKA